MPCDYKNYPKSWKAIRAEILARAGNRCECAGECEKMSCGGIRNSRCSERNGTLASQFNGTVVLTVAHLCHDTHCEIRKHLRAFCQACHLLYDKHHHAKNAAKTRAAKK